MKITRRVMGPDGKMRKEDKVLTINVKPGWKAGTKITFQKEGDQLPGKIPADIVFIIRDKPHPHFVRQGSDIRYTAKVNLTQALTGCRIEVPTLSGERINITIDEVINPTTTKRIKGQGLPSPKEGKRGDLIVGFDIKFPEPHKLTSETKSLLKDLLPQSVY